MIENFRTIKTDVLVVGAGGAGGRAAIEAGRSNVNAILVEKGFMGKSGCTSTRQNITSQSRISLEDRFKYTLGSGCYLNDQDVLWVLLKEAPEDCAELAEIAKETSGARWNDFLLHEIAKYPNISVLEHTIITKLLLGDRKIVGATALDIRSGEFILFEAKAVVLATGGYGDLYRPSECAPLGINGGVWGDGQALAYHVGAELVEMEMTNQQALPDNPRWNLWYRGLWHRYMDKGPFCYQDGTSIPSLSKEELDAIPVGCAPPTAPHDRYRAEIERRIYLASLKGSVYFNMPARVKDMQQSGVTLAPITPAEKALGYDPAKLPLIKIVIGCLLGQGGPRITEKAETTVSGLYAAGECPGNIYGAYRLNPLMDGILPNGRRAGKYAAEYTKTVQETPIDREEVRKEQAKIYNFLESKPNSISPLEVKKKIWGISNQYLFMVRNAKGLREAIKELMELRKIALPRMQAVSTRQMNLNWVDAIEATFAVDVAEMIARSALFREESRGCQYRDDFPEMDNQNWLCHTLLWKDYGTGEMRLAKAPVTMTRYKPPYRNNEEPIPL